VVRSGSDGGGLGGGGLGGGGSCAAVARTAVAWAAVARTAVAWAAVARTAVAWAAVARAAVDHTKRGDVDDTRHDVAQVRAPLPIARARLWRVVGLRVAVVAVAAGLCWWWWRRRR
jgi:hypothetical protein